MFDTIEEIIQLSRDNGYSFFSRERQERHHTTGHPSIYYGRYFIVEDDYNQKRRIYSIYRALKDGACDIVNGQMFFSKKQAERYIKIVLDYEEETTEEYFNG